MDQTTRMPGRSEGRRTLAGVLIIVALVTLAVVIITLDEILASRVEMVDVHAVLPQTDGLASGAPVRIAGHEVGTVLAVTLLPPGPAGSHRVVARARMPREYFDLLRQDSRARTAKPGFVGDPMLEIDPGSGAAAFPEGDTIPPEFTPERVATALAGSRRLLAEVDTLLVSFRAVSAAYATRRPLIDQVARSVQLASTELERTRTAFENSPLRGALADAGLRERLDHVRTALGTLQAGLGRYASGPLGTRLAAAAARADSLQAELATLDSAAASTDGFIGRVRADSALGVEGARTRAQLDSLVEDVTSNPLMFF